ncbi:hypothetical protein BC835DRAFT_1422387 [Cytidiella melzeri]|nr:hypothetical protein BC835DRAFT_1422387 [Cytidiella melzeri]
MLKHQLYPYVHNPEKPINKSVTGIVTLASKLQAIGTTLSEEEITDVLIFNLYSLFTAIATSLMQSTATLTVAGVSTSLSYAKKNMSSTPKAKTSSSSSSKGCDCCSAQGHVARNCPAPAPCMGASSEDSKDSKDMLHTKTAQVETIQLL